MPLFGENPGHHEQHIGIASKLHQTALTVYRLTPDRVMLSGGLVIYIRVFTGDVLGSPEQFQVGSSFLPFQPCAVHIRAPRDLPEQFIGFAGWFADIVVHKVMNPQRSSGVITSFSGMPISSAPV